MLPTTHRFNMFQNYLNIAIRNITKHKFYSIINILGLSIGLTSFLFIAIFVRDELSYESHIPESDQIYRMDFKGSINNSEFNTALMGAPGASHMKANYPEVVDAFRFRGTGTWFMNIKGDEKKYKQEHVVYADSNFFEFWGIKLLQGNPKTCLINPRTLVLDQKTATKIFGDKNPVGQTLVLDNEDDYTVTGVYENMPRNSHFHFNVLLTMRDREEANSHMWLSINFNTYLKLTPGADANALQDKLVQLVEGQMGPEIEQYLNMTVEEYVKNGNYAVFSLFPLKDIHLMSNKLGELEVGGDIKYVYIFTAIGFFILFLACINFMNLATARYSGRAKEVGMRKVLGAVKSQIIRQFLIEAILISLISTAVAFIFCFATLPLFNMVSGKEFEEMELFSIDIVLIMFAITLSVGLIAGSYPALYLSQFRPIETLKGKLKVSGKGRGIRSTLVVFQFVVSITMLICTAVVFDQLSFIRNKKLGFEKERLVMIHDAWILGKKATTYKNEVLKNPRIETGTLAFFLPVGTTDNNNLYWSGKKATGEANHIIHSHYVDHDYIKTLGMQIKSGRDFSKDFISDTLSVIVNESLVANMGYENPIGAFISTYESVGTSKPVSYKIIGVVENFHYTSLKNNIEPILFHLGDDPGYATFKVSEGDMKELLEFLRQTWNEIAPGQPFQYSFLDERFDKIYNKEQQIGNISGTFAFLAIFIAGLGLFGLASFITQQRFKEIGIRKVLGATSGQIVKMLSWDFLKLVMISFVIAAPISYFTMRSWLDDFAFRTEINLWLFGAAAVLTLAVAWITMGFQSYKAAISNPAESLKDE